MSAGVEERIVCAANRKRFTGEVMLGLRHHDSFMRGMNTEGDPVDQGFMTNKGRFVDRKEGWSIAVKNNQIVRRVGGDTTNGGTLYSENLY
jgi:hypothetical protein